MSNKYAVCLTVKLGEKVHFIKDKKIIAEFFVKEVRGKNSIRVVSISDTEIDTLRERLLKKDQLSTKI